MAIAPRPEAFPFYLSPEFGGRLEALRDVRALERHLLSREGIRLNGPPIHGTQHYHWQGPDGGHLFIHIDRDSVSVDTHAHWNDVLDLYEFLCPLEPALLIVDNQTAMLYDASSYRSFVAESYAPNT